MMPSQTIKTMDKAGIELIKKAVNPNLGPTGFLINNAMKLRRHPGVVEAFAKGVISYPITWWGANIQLLCLAGVFGDTQQNFARLRQSIFNTLVRAAIKFPERTAKVVFYYEKAHAEYNTAQVAGRVVGGLITNYYLLPKSKIPILKSSQNLRIAANLAQFIYVSYGAAIMAIAKSVRSLENVVWSMLSGQYTFKHQSNLLALDAIKELDNEKTEYYYQQIHPFLVKILRIENVKNF